MMRAGILALAIVVSACGGEPAAGTGGNVADGKIEDGTTAALEVTISTSTTEPIRVGETLNITVTTTNTGSEPRTVEATSGCFTDYEILDASGNVVGRSGQMCSAVMSSRALDAGEALSESFAWIVGGRGTTPVQPGQYQLRGVLLQPGDTLRSQPVPVVVEG